MALSYGLFSCFSDSSRVSCEGEKNKTQRRSSKAESEADTGSRKLNKSSKKSPPIPVAYFPIGTRFSPL